MTTLQKAHWLEIDDHHQPKSDTDLVRGILRGDIDQMTVLMDRYNQRLYRVCRSLLPAAGEAEEATKDAYVRAFGHMGQFRGEPSLSVWLTRIAVYEAQARRKTQPGVASGPVSVGGLAVALETAADALPANYRTVFMLRHIEGLDADETGACLNLSPETVEARYMRARRILQERLYPGALDAAPGQAFTFRGMRHDRLVRRVMRALSGLEVRSDSCCSPKE